MKVQIAVLLLSLVLAGCQGDPAAPGADLTAGDGATPDGDLPDLGPDLQLPDATVDGAVPDVATPDAAPIKRLLAGAASEDITPGAGVPLGGFGAAPRRIISLATIPAHVAALFGACYDPTPGTVASLFAPNQGKHDPITARALVIDNGTTVAAFVKVDAVAISRQLRDDLEKEAKLLGITKENLIVSATHTHSGPAAVSNQKIWELIAIDCYHKGTYLAMLAGAVKALKRAHTGRVAATVGFGSVSEKRISKNRRDRPGVFDPELGLIKVVNASTNKPIAALMNFAIHGTCLGSKNMLYSADLMGQAETALEKKLGGGVAIFVNGTEGDVSPNQGGFTGATKLGGMLADTAATLWGTTTTQTWFEIQGSFVDETMPSPKLNGCVPLLGDGSSSLCDLLPVTVTIPIGSLMQKKLPFSAIRFGDVVFGALPGEATTDLGLEIKAKGKARGYKHVFVVGLANDFMGYVTTQSEYTKGGYEAQATLYGKSTGDLVVKYVDKQIGAVQKKAP